MAFRLGPETERIIHRAMVPDDAESFFALNSNKQVMRYTGEPLLESVQVAKEAIESYPDFDSVGYGRWACILKSTGEMIGFSGLKFLDDVRLVDIGFRFLPEYWGQGLATESSRACLKFGFEQIGLASIYAFVLPENSGSIRVLEKSGLAWDGETCFDELLAQRYVIHR